VGGVGGDPREGATPGGVGKPDSLRLTWGVYWIYNQYRAGRTCVHRVMVALMVDSKAKVDALHRKALQLGAKDEGPAGPRGEGFYAGYFRDLDGNKLNFFCMG
jgi:predicted lactoylglutathione lyase